jgi:tryptophanyl-tRNA synthetase
MAADMLLYGANYIPVGEDQRQHIEITRDLALRLNNKFGDLFVVPEDWQKQLKFAQRDTGVRIRSLRNPEKKMSKSVEDPAGTIMLSDDPANAAKKIMSATTDSFSNIDYNWERQPGISNLLMILALLDKRSIHETLTDWKDKSSYGQLKTTVAQKVEKFLKDLQSNLKSIDDKTILSKLEQDETVMRKVASERLTKVQKAVGIRPSHA